jgi:hypothetical protein
MSTDKHQGLKKGSSARREQRKASSGEMSTANGFFFLFFGTKVNSPNKMSAATPDPEADD